MNSDAVNPASAFYRHLGWQARRTFRRFPCELTISRSRILAEGATGVPALVNAMGMYDFHNMSLLHAVLARNPATFVDIGANIGPYTLIASEDKKASVVSIEPHPSTFEMLKRNIDINERANVRCLNVALSDHNGQIKLTDQLDSSLNRVVQTGRDDKCIFVRCRRLDDICVELRICPDIVKIDVEGHEPQVLDGFRSYLRETSLLFIEGGERPEIRSAMRASALVGPLYFHHRERTLSSFPQRRVEDPIYLSSRFKDVLLALEIKLAM